MYKNYIIYYLVFYVIMTPTFFVHAMEQKDTKKSFKDLANKSIVLHNALEHLSQSNFTRIPSSDTNSAVHEEIDDPITFLCSDGEHATDAKYFKNANFINASKEFQRALPSKPCLTYDLREIGLSKGLSIDISDLKDFIEISNTNNINLESYSLEKLKKLGILTDFLAEQNVSGQIYEGKIRKKIQRVISGQHPKSNDAEFRKSLLKEISHTVDGKIAQKLFADHNNYKNDMLGLLELSKQDLTKIDALLMVPNLTHITYLYLRNNNLASARLQEWFTALPQLCAIDLSDNKITELKKSDMTCLFEGTRRVVALSKNNISSIDVPNEIPHDVYGKDYSSKRFHLEDNPIPQSEINKLKDLLREIAVTMCKNHTQIKPSLIRWAKINIQDSTKNNLIWLKAHGFVAYEALKSIITEGNPRETVENIPYFKEYIFSSIQYQRTRLPESPEVLNNKLTCVAIVIGNDNNSNYITPKSVLSEEEKEKMHLPKGDYLERSNNIL